MRILPWSLAVPSGTVLIVPRLPFPYLLKSAMIAVSSGSGGEAFLQVLDGAAGELFRSVSEGWASGSAAVVTWAPGLVRGSAYVMPFYDGTIGTTALVVPLGAPVSVAFSCQAGLPQDFWVMPSMELRLVMGLESGVATMTQARLIIGIP